MRRSRGSRKEEFIQVALTCLRTFFKDKFFQKDNLSIFKILFYLISLLLMSLLGYLIVESDNTLANTEKIFNIAISATTQLLGFLISGFAIFAALSDRDLVYIMKRIPSRNISNAESYYDETQIYFFEPFIFLGIACVVSVGGLLFLLIWSDIVKLIPTIEEFKRWFSILYGLYLFLLILCFVGLKDFIFNIFQIGKLYSGFELSRPDVSDVVKKMGDALSKRDENN
jgi:hypothetical protein